MTTKIDDRIFCYPRGERAQHDGFCRIRIFRSISNYVVITELRENPGAIINEMEMLCAALYKSGLIDDSFSIISHLGPDFYSSEEFDFVRKIGRGISFEPAGKDDIISVLQCDQSEFDALTADIHDYNLHIKMLREGIDRTLPKQSGSVFWKNAMARQFKEGLTNLVDAGSIEQEIQRFIKKSDNMHCFADCFADPKDEYVVFSEFPIGENFADFVVFTNRSRLKVVIIEVKGADFNFVNQSGRKRFRTGVIDAIEQIITHKSYIEKNLTEFSRNMHEILRDVLAGKQMHNSHVGAANHLDVSADKNVIFHYAAIGGIRIDELYESNTRHNWEQEKKNTRLDSWTSWINRSLAKQ